MKYADTLRDKVAALVEERNTLTAEAAELAPSETRSIEDVDTRASEIIARAAEIDAEVEAAEKRAAELDALEVERAAAPKPRLINATQTPDRDLYDLEGANRSHGRDLIERARTAVERNPEQAFTDDQREAVTKVLSRSNKHTEAIAQYVLETGSPAYQAEFERFLASSGRAFGPLLERAAMSLTTANGGAMVPYILDPSVMLTNAGVNNPVRQLARVETIAGANEWRGVTSAGVTAEWLGEGSQAADASPTFAQPAIPTFKGAAYLFGSYEVLADSGFASQVQTLIADAKDRLEGTAFTTGNGSSAPQGFITGKVAAGSLVASAATDTFAVGDVYNTQAGLGPRFRNSRSAWMGNVSILNRIRQFDTGGGSSLWAQLAAGQPPVLLGSGIYETSDMDGTITALADNYVLAYGDWQQAYIIVDRVGVEVYYDNLVMGANQRPTGQAGFFAFWRTGGEVVVPEAISLLNVT
jgi:HK97 family phage major capsid protein